MAEHVVRLLVCCVALYVLGEVLRRFPEPWRSYLANRDPPAGY